MLYFFPVIDLGFLQCICKMLRLFLYCGYNEIIESKNPSKRTETVDTQRANDVPTKLTRCCVRALYIRKDWEHNNYYLTESMQPNDHVPNHDPPAAPSVQFALDVLSVPLATHQFVQMTSNLMDNIFNK